MTLVFVGSDGRLPQVIEQLMVVELPVILVYVVYLTKQFIVIALRQAPHDKEFIDTALFLGQGEAQDFIDTFLLGILYEPTGVDDNNFPLRVLAVVLACIAIGFELPHDFLAVDEILRATHSDDVDLVFYHYDAGRRRWIIFRRKANQRTGVC